jgi:hypothetical protein
MKVYEQPGTIHCSECGQAIYFHILDHRQFGGVEAPKVVGRCVSNYCPMFGIRFSYQLHEREVELLSPSETGIVEGR